jgi:isoleucyl-tRNA synthetase
MSGPFAPVRPELDFPSDEAKVLAFWKERRIFEQTLDASTRRTGPSKGTFVFYEGPPTANGMPHNGHVLTRAVKDVFPRYKTMAGWDVPRKAGWDTHGLPVEVEVEKELHIHGKAEIEAYGVEPFTHRCIESVFRYTEAWQKLTDKIGFWVDLPSAYVTFHRSYVESVWWALARLHDKGLLYQGHKVVWWWAQGGTALSSAEVGLGYKTVDDPSVFVAFPLADEPDTALLVWTTTPWTLSSNMYAAVHPAFDYAVVEAADPAKAGGRKLVVAKGLVEPLGKKLGTELSIVRELKGTDLVGTKYVPPFDTFADLVAAHPRVHRVVAADFVLLDASGIVHIAPAFGEDDFDAHKKELAQDPELPLLCAVAPDGTFTERMAPAYRGRFVKDCDKDLQAELRARGLLVHAEAYRHEYPFCWRSDQDPLIQYARPAWYIRTTREIGRAIANNQAVSWLPEHIKEGRFGDFLRNNVDWALSRERYWGTPLPIWQNDSLSDDDPRRTVAIESVAQLRAKKNVNLVEVEAAVAAAIPERERAEHLLVHKPWIDRVTFEEEGVPGVYRRVPEVIDCWFDSGCMPFAQHGFPHAKGSLEEFRRAFPADFISEAIDQTRGWFYSLLMISSLVFDEATRAQYGLATRPEYPHPYKTCVVLGHVGDREGRKESKSKGNYTPPEVILDRVRMEFAALDGAAHGIDVRPGTAVIAREDYEGLDLTGDAARMQIYRADAQDTHAPVELRPTTGKQRLPRRVVALHRDDLASMALVPRDKAIATPPNDVPRLPPHEKVYLEDPSAPAPGADAFRWFFFASSPSWTNTRHSLSNVRLEQKELAVKLRNVYAFFTIYANIDGFDPSRGNAGAVDVEPASLARGHGYRPVSTRPLLDRWILAEAALATREVTRALDGYLLYDAARVLVDLVESLSNWWLRRSRARFWAPGRVDGTEAATPASADKLDAYWTLYEVLVTTARLLAPFTPFFAEELWQNLVRNPWPTHQAESVHLVGWPRCDEARIDAELAGEMRAVREAVSLGLQVRTAARLKVRQPLARVDVVPQGRAAAEAIRRHAALVAEELNVKEVVVAEPGSERGFVDYQLKPNFRALGPKLGKRVQLAKQVLQRADAAAMRADLAERGTVTLDLEGDRIDCTAEEIDVQVTAREGYAAAGGRVGVVVLHTQLTDALRDEGLARELLSRVQGARKDLALGFTERVALVVEGSERVRRVVAEHRELVFGESLAEAPPDAARVLAEAASRGKVLSLDVDGEAVTIAVARR